MGQDERQTVKLRRTVVLDDGPDGSDDGLDDRPSERIAAADVLVPGACVASYEIIRELGCGGMGEVYLARDHDLDRFVAVKLVAEHCIDNLDRFLTEAR